MRRIIWKKMAPVLLGVALLASAAASLDIGASEREQALTSLQQTREALLAAIKGLSPAQWNFKPAPDRWSIAQIVEHVTLAENLVGDKVLAKMAEAPPPSPDRLVKGSDSEILARVADRTQKYKAPAEISPSGQWTYSDALQRFTTAREKTISFLKSTPALRQHAIDHPAFGSLDGHQWLLFMAGHTARHTAQILEVKADPNFPAN